MVAAVATGRATMDRLAAVTFTIKAAAQLRQRFQNALEAALRGETDALARQRLAERARARRSLFVGTIHAFGARLLRERPVEAGMDPGFVEMDEPEDGVARGEAWERFTAGLFVRDDPRLARLIELGIDLRDLEDAFATICENADVEVAAGPDGPEPDFAAARRQVEAFLERAARAIPAEAPPGGWAGFQEAVRSARRLSEIFDTGRARDFVRVLRVLRRADARNQRGRVPIRGRIAARGRRQAGPRALGGARPPCRHARARRRAGGVPALAPRAGAAQLPGPVARGARSPA